MPFLFFRAFSCFSRPKISRLNQNERRNAMSCKFWSTKLLAGIALVAGLAVVATRSGSAQEADVLIEAPVPGPAQPNIKRLERDVIKMKADVVKMATDGMQRKIIAMHGGPPDKMHAIREAATALNEADSDDARSDAKAKLTELLDEFFETDMERREQELAQVEERVTKLRSTLQRRREKKRDILDLQMEVLLNEADGLGFFGGDAFGAPGAPWAIQLQGPAMLQGPPGIQPPYPPDPARAVVAPTQPKPAVGGYGRGGGGFGRGGFGGGYGGGRGGGDEDASPREREIEERGRTRERELERERERERERKSEEAALPK
jgi:hypothetical protein